MLRFMLFFVFFPYVFGGSQCPPRAEIYPCICIDRPIGRSKFDTTVVCHGLANGESLLAIESSLSEMEINRFLLYDSYWITTDARRLQAEARIPVNHISTFIKMDEVEVVDTLFSSFGCPKSDNCRTSYLKRFTAINSTISVGASCNNNVLTISSWISCPGHVHQVVLNKVLPSDITLKPDFFPELMTKLKVLRLSHNNIKKIERRTFSFSKFPVLQTLDLSYNSLQDVRSMFTTSPMKLHHLDLSHNSLRSLVDFQPLPKLHTLKLSDNHLVSLLQNEWQHAPPSLKHIDLTNNFIECNCGMRWINSTFPIHTVLLGSCNSPAEVKLKKLRKASRYYIERCDQEGNPAPKVKKSKQA